MIDRYARKPMADLWSEESRYAFWWRVELAVLEARADRGEIPADTVEHIRSSARYSAEEIQAVEAEVQHDVIAFLTVVAKYVGEESRLIHQGLTSSDVLDTAFALQIKAASEILSQDIEYLSAVLRRRAVEFKSTPTVGRTHGMHAEPTVFGLKFALWADEFSRHAERLSQMLSRTLVGKLSGAVGNYAHTDLDLESRVMQRLGLGVAPISTQIVGRERHAEFLSVLALIAATIEKIAVEIRHLQRTEVGEVFEPFGKKQKGSSGMPHKRNPILCERLTGMARMMRSYAMVGLENVALWHERDISHSSTERVIFPDACVLLDYMLNLVTRILDGLDVMPDRMRENLNLTGGLLASEKVLLSLTEAGWSREKAYAHVQKAAMASLNSGRPFLQHLTSDSEITSVIDVQRLAELVQVEPRYDRAEEVMARLKLM